MTNKPEIILITESWCNNQINNAAISLPGYQLETDLRRDRTDTGNGIGGGLVVYSKNGVKLETVEKFDNIDFNQFCAFKIKTTETPIHIVLMYRPPNSGIDNLTKMCQIISSLGENSIVIGDINLPDIDWVEENATSKGKRLLEVVLEEGLDQLVRFPTHTKGNTLDLVITNCPDKILDVRDVGRLGRSDHCMMEILIATQTMSMETAGRRTDWRKANWDKLKEELAAVNWRRIMTQNSVEEAWTNMKTTIEEAVEKNVPKSTVQGEGKPRWLTREITRLLGRKRKAWKTLSIYRDRENEEKYTMLEREVKNKIQRAKRRMEREIANCTDNNGRKFNRYVKSKTRAKTTVGPLKGNDGQLISDDQEMAACLNNFFSSTFTREDNTRMPIKAPETAKSLCNIEITRKSILEKIKKLKPDSAPGPDKIQSRMLKELANELVEPLRIIFSRTLTEGCMPADWKTAQVIPIYKKGPKGDPGNYRPVSLTSIPCKLLESIIKDKLMHHLNANNLINQTQHGFMPGKSCTTNLIEFLDKVTRTVDNQKSADILYLDFAKAFDKVPKNRLLVKLRAKGVGGQLLAWLEEWLTDRTQKVKVGNAESDKSSVESGVPQGTVLGPPLFTVYIDDLDDFAEQISLLLKFADDTKGMQEIAGPEDRDKLQAALDGLCEWADTWGMAFNVKKCKIMHVGLHNPEYEYYMRGHKLDAVEEEKDVGVIIHKSLKPHKQCKVAAATAGGVLRTVTKNFHFRDRHVFLKLYKQYIRPHLEFATPAWSPWAAADIKMLEKIQERAVGMISGLVGKDYEEKCTELGIETLEKRREKQDLVQTFKILHGLDKINPEPLFDRLQGRTAASTRLASDPMNLRPQRARLEVRRNFFGVRVIDDWNRLGVETKKKKSIEAFKQELKKEHGARP